MALSQEEMKALLGDRRIDPTRTTVEGASYTDPDRFANDKRIADEAGLPVDVVSGQEEEVERSNKIKRIDFERLRQDHPKTANWLMKPDNAKISHDDLETLLAVDREVNRESQDEWWELSKDTFRGFGDSLMISMGKMYDQAAISLLNSAKGQELNLISAVDPLSQASGKMLEIGRRVMMSEEQEKAYRETLDRKINAHKQNLAFAESEIARITPPDLTTMEQGFRGGLQMAADMAPGMLLSLASRGRINITLPYLTSKTYLDSYGSAIVEGKDHETAQRYAGIDAALEFATEKAPTGMLEKIFGEIGKGGIKSSLKKFLVTEAAGEQVATATQTLNAYMHDLDEELARAKTAEDIIRIQGERQAVTFISTVIGGGGMAGTAKGIDYLANRERRVMAKSLQQAGKRVGYEQDQEHIDSLIFLAQSSKTNERAAEVFGDFMENVAPDKKVYLDASIVEELEDVPGYILEQMDGSGGAIEMTMAQFVKDFVNDEARLALVRPHIKTQEGLMTQTEADQDTDSTYIQNMLQKANEAKETHDKAKAMYDQYVDQLVATGRQGVATAQQSAQLIPAVVTTQYEMMKEQGITNPDGSEVTLEQLYADVNIRVAGPGTVRSEEAEFLNQEEADEYALAAAKGLDMSTEARMERARGLGVDTSQVWYHGTNVSFSSFSVGDDRGKPFPDSYISLTPSATRASDFAKPMGELTESQVLPVFVSVSKTFDAQNMTQAEEQSLAAHLRKKGNLARYNAFFDARGYPFQDAASVEEAIANIREGVWLNIENDVVQEWIRNRGYDSFRMKENRAAKETNLAVFNPSQIRSVNAAFDPESADSPSMLAQQNFGDLKLPVDIIDEAGNALSAEIPVQELWDEQQTRLNMVEQLRDCLNA